MAVNTLRDQECGESNKTREREKTKSEVSPMHLVHYLSTLRGRLHVTWGMQICKIMTHAYQE